jgi:hypothetical protein
VECLLRGSSDRTHQKRVVRSKILAFDRKRERRVSAVHGRANIELPDLVRHWVAVRPGMKAIEEDRSKLCQDPHFKSEIGVRGSELQQVGCGDRGVVESCHTTRFYGRRNRAATSGPSIE